MFASSFGLPLPEEVTIISASLTAFMATHPKLYPPPSPDLVGVDPVTLAIVCTLSVFVSDYVIYWIGAFFGDRLMRHKRWGKHFKGKTFQRVKRWVHRYGTLAPFVFRFTPGIRFPGHMMCGVTGLPRWKFILVVGIAAAISVPTQVLLISYYGEVILVMLGKVKTVVIAAALIGFLGLLIYRWKFAKPVQ